MRPKMQQQAASSSRPSGEVGASGLWTVEARTIGQSGMTPGFVPWPMGMLRKLRCSYAVGSRHNGFACQLCVRWEAARLSDFWGKKEKRARGDGETTAVMTSGSQNDTNPSRQLIKGHDFPS